MDSKEYKKEMKKVRELQYKLNAERFGSGRGRLIIGFKVVITIIFLLLLATVIQFAYTGRATLLKLLKGF